MRLRLRPRFWLRFPVLDLLRIFIIGNFAHGDGEGDCAGFHEDLAAEGFGESEESAGGEIGDIAFGELAFHLRSWSVRMRARDSRVETSCSCNPSSSMARRFWISNWNFQLQEIRVCLATPSSLAMRTELQP